MDMINKESRIPLYYQLMEIIVKKIEGREYKENDKLPSERELCEIYGISRATVRQTIQELERAGYVYKQHGIGTFVSPEKFKQDLLKFYSFTEEMKAIGKVPTSIVLSFDVVLAGDKIASEMKINSEDEIYKFERLRLADDEPMMIETSFVPVSRFPGLTRYELDEKSMYDIFSQKYEVVFSMAEENFQSKFPTDHESKHLEIDSSMPCMMIERITYEGENVIEYTTSKARGDKFKYRVLLKK